MFIACELAFETKYFCYVPVPTNNCRNFASGGEAADWCANNFTNYVIYSVRENGEYVVHLMSVGRL